MAGNIGGYVQPQGGGGGISTVSSGSILSGQVSTYNFASGATITNAQFTAAFYSGGIKTILTEEIISGAVAVCVSQSGNLRVAMASISGRMPAIGVVVDNVLSGIQANVYTLGNFQLTSGLSDYSGYLGQLLFVGRSGQLVTSSGSFNSGGLLSGDISQPIGVAINSGSPEISVTAMLPFVAGLITSGNIASGQIGNAHIASGGVLSGNIASGQIGTNHLSSGCVLSGDIASGQIGTNHLSSGCVLSGDIASGQIGQFHIGSGAINSGHYASGSISTFTGASGSVCWGAGSVSPFTSGVNWGIAPVLTEEIISGVRAVCVSQSGNLRVAMASVSGRMPAIGVVMDNILSGRPASVFTQGAFQLSSGLADYSGYLGKTLWVGRSGSIVTFSGSFNSGGLNLASGGDFVQKIGVALNSGAFIISYDATMTQNQLLGVLDLIDVTNRSFGV